MPMMTAEQHITSTLRRVSALQGRPLTEADVETVLLTLLSWVDLLDAGWSPEVVVAIARAEAAMH
jgi:hypothetical protein